MGNRIRVLLTSTGLIIAMLIVMVPVGYICLNHDLDLIGTFNQKATQALGTSNFTIVSYDGYLQAITSTGDKYPSDIEVEQYFRNRSINMLEFYGVLFLGALIIFLIVSLYYSQKTQSYEKLGDI